LRFCFHKIYKYLYFMGNMAEDKIIKEIEKEESKIIKELKKNPWIVGTFVFAIIALILLFVAFKGGGVSKTEIGTKAVEFINSDILQGQGKVTLDSVAEKAGLYEVTVDYNGQKVPAYFTKDGGFYVGTMVVPLTTAASTTGNVVSEPPKTVVKSDKPVVELFIMTHCPYGTQAEKGIIPAIKALGKLVDFKIRFVHYFMHGDVEETETYRQLCIRETQSAKFISYLECFLEDGDASRCLKKLGLNVDSCMNNNKSKEYYAADSKLSNGYGVQGSPTLVINGAETDFYPRSPDNALKVICSAFNKEPAICATASLSTANPDPGFGMSSTPAATGTTATGNAAADSGAACASA